MPDTSVEEAQQRRKRNNDRDREILRVALDASGLPYAENRTRTGYDVTLLGGTHPLVVSVEPGHMADSWSIDHYTRFVLRPLGKLAQHLRTLSVQFHTRATGHDPKAAAAKVVAKLKEWAARAPAWGEERNVAAMEREERERFLVALAERCVAADPDGRLGHPDWGRSRRYELRHPYGTSEKDETHGRAIDIGRGLEIAHPADGQPRDHVVVKIQAAVRIPTAAVEELVRRLLGVLELDVSGEMEVEDA